MVDEIPNISVLIVTYKQEHLISRALDSLLSQRDYIYEICVSDDCSPDNTWTVLQEYSQKYPGLFKLYRNEPNLGMFENFEKTWNMPSGDIVYQLSGDDECGVGWFERVITFIKNNDIDFKEELFCIYGDYKCVYPNGDSFIFSNKAIIKGINPIRLSIRGLIGNRSTCFSTKIIRKFVNVSKGRSYSVESAQDRQLQVFAEKNYYIPYVGNLYYTRIGINISFDMTILAERERVESYAKEIMESLGVKFIRKDLYYFDYKTEKAISYRDHSINNKVKIMILFMKSFDFEFGLKNLNIKRILFAVARRLPHRKALTWSI